MVQFLISLNSGNSNPSWEILSSSTQPPSQVILKQQRVIKRLLKKCHASGGNTIAGDNGETDVIKMLASDVAKALGTTGIGGGGKEEGGKTATGESRLATELLDGQNDSDSAIMLEDHLTEVR